MHAGDSAQAHRECYEGVLDDILPGIILPEIGQQMLQRVGWCCELQSYGQGIPRGPYLTLCRVRLAWLVCFYTPLNVVVETQEW